MLTVINTSVPLEQLTMKSFNKAYTYIIIVLSLIISQLNQLTNQRSWLNTQMTYVIILLLLNQLHDQMVDKIIIMILTFASGQVQFQLHADSMQNLGRCEHYCKHPWPGC